MSREKREGHVLRVLPVLSSAVACLPPLVTLGLLYGPILFAPPGYAPATMFHDFYSLFYPAAHIAENLVQQGEIPTWNPYSFCGMPFLASIQMGALYPPNWLHLVLAPERAFCVLLVAHMLLAFAGTWFYCRGRGRSNEAALFAAMVYAVSGRIVLHVYAGHPHLVYSAAWLPAVFCLMDRVIKKPVTGNVCVLALVLAAQFLCGFPMFSLLLAYLLPCYALAHVSSSGATPNSPGKPVRAMIFAVILALGLGAVQLLPTLEYMQESHRGDGLDYGWATTGSYPAINLITFLVPGFFGDEINQRYWAETSLWESTAFCGVTTLLFAFIGAASMRADRTVRFWLLSGLVVMFVAMGRYSYLYDFAYAYLPGVKLFRGVSKLSVFVTLALAVLSSWGFDEVFSKHERAGRIGLVATLIVLVSLLGLGWATFEQTLQAPAPVYWQHFIEWVRSPPSFSILKVADSQVPALAKQSYAFMLSGVSWCCIIVAGIGFIVLLRFRFRSFSKWAALGILGMELTVHAFPLLQCGPAAKYLEPATRVRQAISEPPPWRLCNVSDDDTLTNQFVYTSLAGIGWVDASLLKRYTQLFKSLTGADPQFQTYFAMPVVHQALFDLLNVRFYTAAADIPRVGDTSGDKLLQEGVFEHRGRRYDLYENSDALPYAFLVHQVRHIDYPEFGTVLLPSLLKNGARNASFVEGHLDQPIEPVTDEEARRERCEILEYRPTRVRIEVNAQRAALLMINESYFPGWTAAVDGRSTKVYPANFVMRGLVVPAGKHTIEMKYEPRAFRLGAVISLATLVLTAGLWARSFFARPQTIPLSDYLVVTRPELGFNGRWQQLTRGVVAVLYHSSLIAAFVLVGGWLYCLFGEEAVSAERLSKLQLSSSLWAFLASLIAAVTGWLQLQMPITPSKDGPNEGSSEQPEAGLARTVASSGSRVKTTTLRPHRRLLLATLSLGLLFPLTVLLVEIVARSFVPAWPALGLHGVAPDVAARSWSRVVSRETAVGLNAWGQRDFSRAITPPSGTTRIAFVGDSFLEESSTTPLSVRVEQLLRRNDVEVINLGVSASSPDDYYHRIRRIALPLGARHCVMFIFAGNDFVEDEQSLTTYEGVAAVYPRGSFLQSVGLLGLNHLLTNRARPVIRAWLGSGDLRKQEEYRQLILSESDDATIQQLLLSTSGATPEQLPGLIRRLSAPEMQDVYAMLKSPDAGQFRSYYLSQALSAAAGGKQWERNSETSALFWARRARTACEAQKVRFTLVIIPEGCQVDSRMAQQWSPLANMRHLTKPCRDAALRLVEQAKSEKFDIIDLHEVLQDIPGTYLNLDGHWSDKGIEIVAQLLTKRLATD